MQILKNRHYLSMLRVVSDPFDHPTDLLDLLARDIQMGDHSDRTSAKCHGLDPVLFECRGVLLRGSPDLRNMKNQDVRLGFRTHHFEKFKGPNRSSQPFGVLMVQCQSLDVVIERIETCSRDDPHLPHPTTEQLPSSAGLGDELFGSDQARPERYSEAFAQADAYGIEGIG